jgi:ribosomal-protein-alanine N-acetyltransferase
MTVLETERLLLRRLTVDDAPFVLGLLNEPSFLRHIGDRGVRTVEQAETYLRKGPLDMYRSHGHGLYLVELREGAVPLGICGLIRRPALEDVDIGFAFKPEHWGKGYAYEAAAATLEHGRRDLGLARIVAIVAEGNEPSARLCEKLGLRYERRVRLSPQDEELLLFAIEGGAA